MDGGYVVTTNKVRMMIERAKLQTKRAVSSNQNANGLTFKRWLAAAGIGDGHTLPSGVSVGRLFDAWREGEDPSDYRAER